MVKIPFFNPKMTAQSKNVIGLNLYIDINVLVVDGESLVHENMFVLKRHILPKI